MNFVCGWVLLKISQNPILCRHYSHRNGLILSAFEWPSGWPVTMFLAFVPSKRFLWMVTKSFATKRNPINNGINLWMGHHSQQKIPRKGGFPKREPRCRDTQQCRQAKWANAVFCGWMNIDVLSVKNAAGWSDAKLHFSICCTSRFVYTWRWVKNEASTALCTLGW